MKQTSSVPTSSAASAAKPTPEEISARAEVLWRAKGEPQGRDEEIWLEAERQLADEHREILGGTGVSPSGSRDKGQSPRSR